MIKNNDYYLVEKVDAYSNILFVFASKKTLDKQHITFTVSSKVKAKNTLLIKDTGNIGGLLVRMNIYDKSYCFINCALPSGRSKDKNKERFAIL